MAAGRLSRWRRSKPEEQSSKRPSLEGQSATRPGLRLLSTWTLVTLSLSAVAVIALAATALFLGRDAVIALAVICVAVFLGINWLLG